MDTEDHLEAVGVEFDKVPVRKHADMVKDMCGRMAPVVEVGEEDARPGHSLRAVLGTEVSMLEAVELDHSERNGS